MEFLFDKNKTSYSDLEKKSTNLCKISIKAFDSDADSDYDADYDAN